LSGDDYRYEAADRVLYMADELIKNRKSTNPVVRDSGTPANNPIGVYVAYRNQHVTLQAPPFFDHSMTNGLVTLSFHDALRDWTISLESSDLTDDRCWIQDADTIDQDRVTYVVTALDGTGAACHGWTALW
jgi:hypothetical protein